MTQRTFRIMCSSEHHLTAEEIALALLKYVAALDEVSEITFGVMEVKEVPLPQLQSQGNLAA